MIQLSGENVSAKQLVQFKGDPNAKHPESKWGEQSDFITRIKRRLTWQLKESHDGWMHSDWWTTGESTEQQTGETFRQNNKKQNTIH